MKMEIKRNTVDCHGNVGLATACGSGGQIKEPCGIHVKEGI